MYCQACLTMYVASMSNYAARLEREKKRSTAQLLFRCARQLNELALRTLPEQPGPRPRPAHMALFPHIELEGTRPTELATRLGISKQAVGQLLDDLEAMGTVVRVPDPSDRRAKLVVFSEEGRAQILEGLAHLLRIEGKLRRALGKETMDQLRDALLALDGYLAKRP